MLIEAILKIAASLVEGITSDLLRHNLRSKNEPNLNHCESDDDDVDDEKEILLVPDSHNLKRRILEDFGDKDYIYEEFSVPHERLHTVINEVNAINHYWKRFRGPSVEWMKKCMLYSFCMVILGSFFISAVAIIVMFIHALTADVCINTAWKDIPESVQRFRVVVHSIDGFGTQFIQVLILVFAFGWKLIHQLNLLPLNLIAAFLDCIYRLVLQLYDSYNVPWRSYPMNFLFFTTMVRNVHTVSCHFCRFQKQKLILAFQLGSQIIFGSITVLITIYVVIPWFVTLDPNSISQTIIAALVPIIGTVGKTLTRISVQNMQPIVHPGSSHLFVGVLYGTCALLYRTLQAKIQNLKYFTLLCIVHGFISLLERISVVLRDLFYTWSYKRILKTEQRFKSFTAYIKGSRTPRSQRLAADLVICSIVYEVVAVLYTNAMVQLYTVQLHGMGNMSVILKEFISRTLIALLSEYVFAVFGVFIITWYLNLPLIRVWKKKWRSFLFTNVVMCVILVLYLTDYLIGVVSAKYLNPYEHTNGTMPCNTTELLLYSQCLRKEFDHMDGF